MIFDLYVKMAKVSINAALHSLGRALALRDEIMIDCMMKDVVPVDSPDETLPL